MLFVSHLSKSFNRRSVLKNITFDITAGETIVIMGKNGAGKSILLRIIARIMACDKGSVKFQNHDLLKGVPVIRKDLLYLGHAPAMYSGLSAMENLSLTLQLRGTPVLEEEIIKVLDQYGLLQQKDDPITIYSQGMLQRLKLTYAELAQWSLLLMDEPFSGLDDDGTAQMHTALIQWKSEGKTMCLVLHDEAMATKYGDRILRLKNGEIQTY